MAPSLSVTCFSEREVFNRGLTSCRGRCKDDLLLTLSSASKELTLHVYTQNPPPPHSRVYFSVYFSVYIFLCICFCICLYIYFCISLRPVFEVTLEAPMGHDAERRRSSVANQRKEKEKKTRFRASTSRHTHPTCVSRVALFQVLVVAGALGRRNDVVRGLRRKRDTKKQHVNKTVG